MLCYTMLCYTILCGTSRLDGKANKTFGLRSAIWMDPDAGALSTFWEREVWPACDFDVRDSLLLSFLRTALDCLYHESTGTGERINFWDSPWNSGRRSKAKRLRSIYIYIYIYMYALHTHNMCIYYVYTYIYIYIYTQRVRERYLWSLLSVDLVVLVEVEVDEVLPEQAE